LLVHDEDDINLVIKLVLEGSDFEVDSFSNPLIASESFEAGVYDLAILGKKQEYYNITVVIVFSRVLVALML
jgi:DNA-binding response OmpR family regulator